MRLKLADRWEVYRKKLDVTGRWASPIATADGRIYFTMAGKSVVIQSGPTFKTLAVNDLGDPSHALPAFSNGRVFLKGEYDRRGWMMNFAWDPVGKVCYVARMGQAAWKYEY